MSVMKKLRAVIIGALAGATALIVSSCAYDPYYSGSSYGYGDGYGYGGSNFSTSFFVQTNSPRWGYDPYARCYYDYQRRSYYDPHLYGYYPVGYRPRYVHGAPHPHGWSQGSGRHIAPPSRVRSYDLKNYGDRGERYRNLGRDWSRDIQVNSHGYRGHDQNRGSSRSDQFRGSDRYSNSNQNVYRGHSPYQNSYSRDSGRDQRSNFNRNSGSDQRQSFDRNRNQPAPSRGGRSENLSVNSTRSGMGGSSDARARQNGASQEKRNNPPAAPEKRKYSRYDDRGIRNNVKR